MKKISILIFILSTIVLSSCRTTKSYENHNHSRVDSVLIERVDTIIKELHTTDSIFVQTDVIERDSVWCSEKVKGDTVFVEKYVYKYIREASKEKEYSLRDSLAKYSTLERDLEILRDSTVDVEQREVETVRNKISSGILKLILPFVFIFLIFIFFRKRW